MVPNPHDETINGIKVCAVPIPQGRLERMTLTTWYVLWRALRLRGDCYHFHDPELIPAGIILKFFGRRVIYDVHEDVPASIRSRDYIPRPLRWTISACMTILEKIIGLLFDAFCAATPSIARRFPKHKTTTLQNFPLLGDTYRIAKSVTDSATHHRIVYTGNIARERGAVEMVRAMARVNREIPATLTLVGRFSPPALEQEIRQMSAFEHVDFLGWRSYAEANEVMEGASVGLVLYHPAPNHTEAMPNKMFEYMGVGIPVIASFFPLWKWIVEEARCGLVCDPCDPQAIGDAILWILKHRAEAHEMSLRGMEAARTKYNWSAEETKMLELYDRILHHPGPLPARST
ncbi:MAG: glycosyltransferase family 4 protein [Pseudomonadota bacterium]